MLSLRSGRQLGGFAAATLVATLLVAPVALTDASVGVASAAPAASAASAGSAVSNLGPGNSPGLAVDAAGTAYVVWNGPEFDSTLRFCRLPRGATACAPGLTSSITTVGNSLTRPFITVSGSTVRVVSYRYPQSGTEDFSGTYEYTSTNSGSTFADGVRVGSVPFFESVPGPGDTLSGVTDANQSGMVFQNVPLGGGTAGEAAAAVLSTDHPYAGSVGLVNASTPLAVFTDGSYAAQFRQYDGSGSLNDVANWTTAVDIGDAAYPKLTGGPGGLFMVAGNASGGMFVRYYDGFGFAAALSLGAGNAPNHHLSEDAAGRLHSVVERSDANGLHLIYWISDDVGEWRSETVASQNPGIAGAFNDPRVETAADHIGFAVWSAGTAGDIRIVPVGPDVSKPEPAIKPSGSARHSANVVVVKTSGKLVRPAGVAAVNGCKGDVKVSIKRGTTVIAAQTVSISKLCTFSDSTSLKATKVGNARKLKLLAKFTGNHALASTTETRLIKVQP